MNENTKNDRLEAFLSDPDFNALTQWSRSINFFDIISPSETKISSLIAWLLKPKESHGLGDRLIKQLLIEVYKASSLGAVKTQWMNDIRKELGSVFSIESSAYSEAYVFCEFPSPIGKDRIDIVIIDETNGIAIFIENKYGAKLSKNQLQRYYTHFNNLYLEQDFLNIFIYLDDIEEHIEKNWIHLDYDWISSFLRAAIINESFSGPPLRIIKDFYLYLTEDYSLDERYGDSWRILKQLYRNHINFLNDLRHYKSKNGKSIYELSYTDVLQTSESSYDYRIFKIYHSNANVISTLLNMSEWEPVYEAIVKKTGNEALIDQKRLRFFFTTAESNALTEEGSFDFWPIEVGIEKRETTYETFIRVHNTFQALFDDEIEPTQRERMYYEIRKDETPIENIELVTKKALRLYELLEEKTAGKLKAGGFS